MNECDLSAIQFIDLNTSVLRYSCWISCHGGWEAVAHLFQFDVCLNSFLNLKILFCYSSSGSIQAAISNLVSPQAAPVQYPLHCNLSCFLYYWSCSFSLVAQYHLVLLAALGIWRAVCWEQRLQGIDEAAFDILGILVLFYIQNIPWVVQTGWYESSWSSSRSCSVQGLSPRTSWRT